MCVCALAAGLTVSGWAQTVSSPQQFLDLWGKAWDAHDVEGIMRLYADDCITVSRFGVVANGKDEVRRNVTWLNNGPFHAAHFGAPRLLDARKVAPNVLVLHANWKNPSGRPSQPDDELVMTVTLKDLGSLGWLAEEVDTHTVDPLAPSVTPDNAPADKPKGL